MKLKTCCLFIFIISACCSGILRAATTVSESGEAFSGTAEKIEMADGGLRLLNRWQEEDAPGAPGARRWHTMWGGKEGAYLFGTVGSSETFRYAGGSWQQLFPASGPSPRYSAEADGGLLFGGYDGNILNDTWLWNEQEEIWHQIETSTTPPGRYGHSLAVSGGRGLMFGGGLGSSYTADTWEFDLQTRQWEEKLPPLSPSPRLRAAMASAGSGKVVLFGGEGVGEDNKYLDDTWVYDTADFSWRLLDPAESPPPRRRASMAWNPREKVVVLFGGRKAENELLNDIWVFNPETENWYRQQPRLPDGEPLHRQSAAMAFYEAGRQIILFGGDWGDPDGQDMLDDTWSYSLSSSGTYTSAAYDAGQTETELKYLRLEWEAAVPEDGNLRLQLAVSETDPEPELFRGPDGSTNTYFGVSGQDISSFFDGKRYFRYRLYMDREDPGSCAGFVTQQLSATYNHSPGAPSHAGPPFSSAEDGGQTGWPVRFEWHNSYDADGDKLEYELKISTMPGFQPVFFTTSGIKESYNWTHFEYNLPHGSTYYWKVRAFDGNAWGEYSVPWSLVVDTVPPRGISEVHAQRSEYSAGAVDLSWTAPDDEGYSYVIKYDTELEIDNELRWNAAPYESVYIPEDGIYQGKQETFTVGGLSNATTYYFAVRVSDKAGNLSEIAQAQCRTNARPQVWFSSPVAGEWGTASEKSTPYIAFNYEVYDPDPEDSHTFDIQMALDKEGPFDIAIAEGIEDKEYEWDSREELNYSAYYIRLSVRDKRNLQAHITTGPVIVNNYNEPPAVEILSPAGGEYWEGINTVRWDYSDPNRHDTHFSRVLVSTDGGKNFHYESARLGNGVKEYQWGTGNWPDSKKAVIKVAVRDNRGLEGEAVSEKFEIFNTFRPPGDFGLVYPDPEGYIFLYYSTPTLRWEESYHPDGLDFNFTVVISTHEDFRTRYDQKTFPGGITEYESSLEDEKIYYWKVTAVDSELVRRESSSAGKFAVNTDPIRITSVEIKGSGAGIDGKWLVMSGTETIVVHFNKPVAVSPHAHVSFSDQYGNNVGRFVSRQGNTIEIRITPAIAPSRRYRLVLGSGLSDIVGHPLLDGRAEKTAERTVEFVRLLCPADETEIIYPGKASLQVPAGVLGPGTTGYISMDEVALSDIKNAEDAAYLNPEVGDKALNVISLNAFDLHGEKRNSFSGNSTLRFFYLREGVMVKGEDIDAGFLEIFRLTAQGSSGNGMWETIGDAVGSATVKEEFVSVPVSKTGVYSLRAYAGSGKKFSGLLIYPNPFDPGREQLKVMFNLGKTSRLSFEIYTLTGDLVYRQEENFSEGPGRKFTWDGRNARQSRVANGMYYARIREKGEEVKSFLIGVLQ